MPDAPSNELAKAAKATGTKRIDTLTAGGAGYVALCQLLVLLDFRLQRGTLDAPRRDLWAQAMATVQAIIDTDTQTAQLVQAPRRLVESKWPTPDPDAHPPVDFRLGMEQADVTTLIAAEAVARQQGDATEASLRDTAIAVAITVEAAARDAAIAAAAPGAATTTVLGLVKEAEALTTATATSVITKSFSSTADPTHNLITLNSGLISSATGSLSNAASKADTEQFREDAQTNFATIMAEYNTLRARVAQLETRLQASGALA